MQGVAVDAVIFDWGGTLTPWHTVDLAEQWRVYARAYDPNHGDEVAAALRAAEDEAWRVAREEHRSTTFDAVVRSAGLEPSGRAHARALEAYHAFWEPHTFTDPQVRPLWEGLHARGIRVGVLSNTIWTRDYHRGIFERDGVLDLLDADLYSSEIDHVKPHPEAFRAICRELDVAPRRAVYVGDRVFEDVHGPQQVGMRAIWIPHSDIPAAQRVEVTAVPDGHAHQLLDVLDIVDAWIADT